MENLRDPFFFDHHRNLFNIATNGRVDLGYPDLCGRDYGYFVEYTFNDPLAYVFEQFRGQAHFLFDNAVDVYIVYGIGQPIGEGRFRYIGIYRYIYPVFASNGGLFL